MTKENKSQSTQRQPNENEMLGPFDGRLPLCFKCFDLLIMRLLIRLSFQVYAMSKKVRGQCLIVNNEKFDDGDEREGSAVDAANLEFLFGKLGFQVNYRK